MFRMQYWVIILIAFAALLLGFGEPLVCVGFFALPFIGWRSRNLPLRIGTLLVAVTGLFLHSQGYKLFGSPKIVATSRLEGAVAVVGIEPPSRVRFANGKTALLEGIYFPQAIDLTVRNERTAMLWNLLGDRSQEPSLEIRMLDDGRRGECLRRNRYWCGNTFFPTVLPCRLPSHTPEDIGPLFVGAGLALPSGATGDRAYQEELLEAFDRSVAGPQYPASGLVRRGDAVAVALGTSLISPSSRRFVAGAYLLIAAQEVEAYPGIEREIHRRQQRNRDDYDAVAQCRSSDLDTLLAWINVDEARQRVLVTPPPFSMSGMNAGFVWGTNAAIIASHGDLSGLDQVISMMSDDLMPPAARETLLAAIPHYFKWPGESRLFSTWYAAIHPRLRTGRDEFGGLVFWLDDGKPFDDTYRRSIEQVTERR